MLEREQGDENKDENKDEETFSARKNLKTCKLSLCARAKYEFTVVENLLISNLLIL